MNLKFTGDMLRKIVVQLINQQSVELNCVGIGTNRCSVMASELKGAHAVGCPWLNRELNN